MSKAVLAKCHLGGKVLTQPASKARQMYRSSAILAEVFPFLSLPCLAFLALPS